MNLGMGLMVNIITISGIVTLYLTGHLTILNVCFTITLSSLIAGITSVIEQRRHISILIAEVSPDFLGNWRNGKWIFTATIITFLGVRTLPWLTLIWCGKEAVAAVGAITAISCAIRPMLEASVAYLTPKLAHHTHGNGVDSAKEKGLIIVRVTGAVGSIYVLLMLLGGNMILKIVYGMKYQGYAIPLAILAAAVSVKAIDIPVRALLTVTKRSKKISHSSTFATVSSLIAAVLIIPRFGITGTASVVLLHSVILFCSNYYYMFCQHQPKPIPNQVNIEMA
jgi:O-antigen/teichoic acid export membrane protein